MRQARFQRPGHADFEYPDADVGADGFGNAHVFKRLHDIEVRLARGDDAKAGVGAILHDPIQAVDPGKFAGSIDLIFV